MMFVYYSGSIVSFSLFTVWYFGCGHCILISSFKNEGTIHGSSFKSKPLEI